VPLCTFDIWVLFFFGGGGLSIIHVGACVRFCLSRENRFELIVILFGVLDS
jgi:hypothetical protein